jgi:CspA family cold shock protein
MSSGTIRTLIKDHGFGFIASNGGRDIFFHYSQLEGINFNLLRKGQSVNYKIGLGSKGLEAIDVKLSDKPTHSMSGV